MQNELIVVSDYCDKCHIEPSFIDLLQENGLVDILFDEGRPCPTWSVTAVCTTIYLSIWKGSMPSITCWNVWTRCNARYATCVPVCGCMEMCFEVSRNGLNEAEKDCLAYR